MAATAEPAGAHVDVRPDLLEQGAVTEVRVELPQIRPGPALVRLEVEGDGVAVLSTRRLESPGVESLWSVRLRVDAEPGRVVVVLRPFYADGESVEFEQALTVVPATEGSSVPWIVAVAGAALAVALAIAALVVARRRA